MNAKEREQQKQLIKRQLDDLPSTNKPRPKDGSAVFKIVGGKQHGVTIRIFLPMHDLEYSNGEIYEPSPPIGTKSKAWIYLCKNPQGAS